MADVQAPFPGAPLVEALAACAGLELGRERLAAVTAILQAWREGAEALNRLMSAPAHAGLIPVTVLSHAAPPAAGAANA